MADIDDLQGKDPIEGSIAPENSDSVKSEAPGSKKGETAMEKVDRIRASAKARAKDVATVTSFVAQLPLWDERVRGLPNSLARSALFTSSNRSVARDHCKFQRIATLKGAEIHYTGEELRQDDGDVFLQLVHLARQQPLGEIIEFSGYALLKELGWTTSKGSYERLRECINRLSATSVVVKSDGTIGDKGYGGSLIRKFEWNADAERGTSQRWKIWLEPEIVVLFGRDSYTRIDWEQRLSLPPLAKWLHQFYFTHEKPLGYKVETIKILCGSRIAVLAKFRYKLRESLEMLVSVGFLTSFAIDSRSDVLSVERAPRRISDVIEQKKMR